ncbi:protochlorophyllide reductase [Cryptosporangium japonicum]|uniref:Protochlorophyllide reductase n=2 Tax=Cryptosporangium japonicum TaxID=80872 RepID=A0ABN0U6I8_9ACTN
MTGGTRGIGAAAVGELLRRDPGLRMVLLARGDARPGDRTTVVPVDLADRTSTRTAVATVRAMLADGTLPPLRGIVGNAGVSLADAIHATPDGLETTFAVNVVANHVLIAGLAPALPGPGRVVITVSDTHFGDFKHTFGTIPAPRWAEPAVLARPGAFPRPATATAGRTAYSTSKLAAIYLVHEWARRLPPGVDVVAHNPGLVPGTGLAREAGPVARLLMGVLSPPMTLTPLADSVTAAGRKLADVVLGATAAPTGSYVDRTAPALSSGESYDPERERALWEYLERIR